MGKRQFIRTIRKSGTSLAVNIPPEIIMLLGLRNGDVVEVNANKGEVKILNRK